MSDGGIQAVSHAPRRSSRLRGALAAACALLALELAEAQPHEAPVGGARVWHLGRITGDLERIVAFYHDLLGLGFRGDRAAPIAFSSVPAINEFVAAPAHAEFRAAFLSIPGASAATVPAEQIYLEAFEYRNIDRRQIVPDLRTPGVSSLRFFVRDLDAAIAAARSAGVVFVTAGGEPAAVLPPLGHEGAARAVVLRDPDGYAVELIELELSPATFAPADSRIVGAAMSVVVSDLDAAIEFYRTFLSSPLNVRDGGGWQSTASTGLDRLRAIPVTRFRRAALDLPGTTLSLELIEFADPGRTPYAPVFQDIGIGHVALLVDDIDVVLQRMNDVGARTIATSGTWTRINPSLRALYTRDRDGFFIEVIERRPPQ